MRTIFLSPHLDDAVICAGAYIRSEVDAGSSVEIWTFMAGFPEDAELSEFAQLLHRLWGFENAAEAVQSRRNEDLKAAELVGARAVHFDFLDCIYRRDRTGQPMYPDITLPIQAADADLPAQVAQTMVAWLRPEDRVICQLGIGDHVDHIIVRKAAEMLHRPLIYMADMPYVLNHAEELEPCVRGMDRTRQPVSEAGLDCWISAIECYASQVDSVYGGHEQMLECMRSFWEENRGIDFWTVPASS